MLCMFFLLLYYARVHARARTRDSVGGAGKNIHNIHKQKILFYFSKPGKDFLFLTYTQHTHNIHTAYTKPSPVTNLSYI